MSVDWSRWMQATPDEREQMRRQYRDKIVRDSEANAWRWQRMSPSQKARYPEFSQTTNQR